MLIYKASMVNNIINASQSYSHFKANTSFFYRTYTKEHPRFYWKNWKCKTSAKTFIVT